jgi:hypothetical protein
MRFQIIITFLVFATYNIYIICRYEVPESLSQTSYMFLDSGRKCFPFSFLCIFLSFTLFPTWLAVSMKHLRYLVYFSLGGLTISGLTPMFRKGIEKPLHYLSAVLTFVGVIAWFSYSDVKVLLLDTVLVLLLIVFKKRYYVYSAEVVISLTLMTYIFFKL